MKKDALKARMITNVMIHFDFAKVHDVMKSLDWKWYISKDVMRVSDQSYISDTARMLLKGVMRNFGDGKFHCQGYGGLMAALDADGLLSLQFILEEMSSDSRDFDNT